MATTQILPFCTTAAGSGGNRLTPSAYAALTALLADGYEAGIAQSVQVNTTLAQASFMAAGLANFCVAQGVNVPDDGNLTNLVTEIETAIQAYVTGFVSQNLYRGGTTTGSGNAQVLASVVPASGFSLSNNGSTIICTAGATNTLTATFQLTSPAIGPVTIYKDSAAGLVPLTGGEIVAGDTIMLTVNTGIGSVVLTSGLPLGAAAYLNLGYGVVNDGSGNLAVSINNIPVKSNFFNLSSVWASNTTVTLAADAIILSNSSNQVYKARGVSVTLNTALTGAGGLDTGSLAANTWYYGYFIYNGTTVTSLFSTSSTTPTLPSGYTYASSAVTAFQTDGSKNIIGFSQKGADVTFLVGSNLSALPQIASGTAGSVSTPTWTSASYATTIPVSICAKINLILCKGNTTASGPGAIAAPNTGYGKDYTNPPPLAVSNATSTTSGIYSAMGEFVIVPSVTSAQYASADSDTSLSVMGYTLNI